jgi:hypothetical protein
MPLRNIASTIEEKGVSLCGVLKYRKAGTGSARRVELFLSNECARDELAQQMKRANLSWKVAHGREMARRVAMRHMRSGSDPQSHLSSNTFSPLIRSSAKDVGLVVSPSHSTQTQKMAGGTTFGLSIGTLNIEGGEGKEVELLELLESEGLDCLAAQRLGSLILPPASGTFLTSHFWGSQPKRSSPEVVDLVE